MTTAVLCHEAVPRITGQLCIDAFLSSSPQLPEINKVVLIIQEFIPAKGILEIKRILEIHNSKKKAAVSSGGGKEKIKQNIKRRKKIIQICV